jgi:hypothetical protein
MNQLTVVAAVARQHYPAFGAIDAVYSPGGAVLWKHHPH